MRLQVWNSGVFILWLTVTHSDSCNLTEQKIIETHTAKVGALTGWVFKGYQLHSDSASSGVCMCLCACTSVRVCMYFCVCPLVHMWACITLYTCASVRGYRTHSINTHYTEHTCVFILNTLHGILIDLIYLVSSKNCQKSKQKCNNNWLIRHAHK